MFRIKQVNLQPWKNSIQVQNFSLAKIETTLEIIVTPEFICIYS